MLVFVLYLGEIFLYKRSNRHESCRPYPIVTITPKGERAIVDGHPWVYEGEVLSDAARRRTGSLVDVDVRKRAAGWAVGSITARPKYGCGW